MNIKNKDSSFNRFRALPMINWWVTWIIQIGVGFYLFYITGLLTHDFSEALNVLKSESKGIVLVDTLGRPSVAKKVPMNISDPIFKKVIINNIQHYFLVDWVSLTNNYQNKITTTADLEKYNSKFPEFKEHFLPKDNKKVKKEYLSFEKYIVYNITNDNLPEMISVTKGRLTSYQTQEDTFTGKVVFELIANIYNSNADEYQTKRGSVTFEVEGYFDSTEGDIINPLGLMYTDLKTAILTKK